MKPVLVVLVLLVAVVVGLGFYRGWFSVAADKGDAKSNVTLTVDQDKIQEDRERVVANVQDFGSDATGAAAGPSEKTMEGTVVSVSDSELTMTDEAGKQHPHTLAANVEVTCDGKICEAAELKPGMRIRVTTQNDDSRAAIRIEALDQHADFEEVASR